MVVAINIRTVSDYGMVNDAKQGVLTKETLTIGYGWRHLSVQSAD